MDVTLNKGTLRVLHALSLFVQKPTWGVTEASRELGCSKNSAFQALDTLLEQGYVVRDASGLRYQVAHQSLRLVGDGEDIDIRHLCRDYMFRLHEITSQGIFLSIIVGRYNVCIDSVHGSVVRYSPLSEPMPLHAGTGSRLLLSFLDDAEIESYVEKASPLQKIMPNTITDPDELWEEVQLVRARGFARGYGDFTTGANYLSFPVMGALNRPLAAITIGGPVAQFTREVADSLIPAIQTVMSQLNQQSRFFPSLPLIRF